MEQTIVGTQTVAPSDRNGKFSTQTVKAMIAAGVSLICLICLLCCSVVGRELADIGVSGSFSGAAVIGALFGGGKLSYFYMVDGEKIFVTAYLPTGINVLFFLAFLLFLGYFAYEVCVVLLSRKREESKSAKLNNIGGWAAIGIGLFCVLIYILSVTLTVKTEYVRTMGLTDVIETDAFYKIFFPSILWLIFCPVLLISGAMQRKIDANQVVLLKRYIPSYLFMIVPLVLIAIFNIYPIILQTVLSFKEYSLGTGIFNSPWVGLKNFAEIFQSPEMLRVIGNTLYISLLRLIGSTLPPLILSIFLYDMRLRRTKNVVQTVVYVPHFFSWVIIYAITYAFLNEEGLLSVLTGNQSSILTDSGWFIPIVIITAIWKELGWGTILYLAALSSVPPELHEAAKLDGAGPWQRVWNITLPNILPIVMYLLIINLGQILKNAGGEQLLLFATAVTKPQATVIDTWLYWESLGELKYSLGAAMSFFQAAVGMVLVFGCNRLSRKLTGIGMW